MSPNRNEAPESPAEAWLNRTFPLRHGFCAEIGADLRSHTLIPVDVAYKSFLGDLMERAIGLSLCGQPPYLNLFHLLGDKRAARLLRLAGYDKAGAVPTPADVFLVAYRLAQVNQLLNPRWGGRVDPEAIACLLRRHPDALPRHCGETNFEWLAFEELWASYSGGFRATLRSYGDAIAQVPLLGGRRHADFLVGRTVLEVKSGRLDRETYILQLINQLIGYGLLAHFNGHTVTHVAVYAVRYQRVLRFRIEPLLTRLAGRRLSLDTASADFAEAVDNRRHGTTAA
jgi:hypothetical protein